MLIIVVNFDRMPAHVAVNIPPHAFEYLNMPQKEAYKATDLLSGQEETISLLPYKATELSIEATSGKILKVVFDACPQG